MQKIRARDITGNYLYVLPAVILFLTFHIYPFINVFRLSLFRWDGLSPVMQFVGLANFRDIFTASPEWWASMWHAFYITILTLIFQNGFALILALACDRAIRGANIYRIMFFIPPVLSGIVVGLIWQWIYDGNYGLLNYSLEKIGFGYLSRTWLEDPKTALTCVAIVHMWKGFGWGFIILLAGLQSIPRQLYEAARVDGAGAWDIFRKVIVPLMVPVFILVIILTILNTMQIYDIILATSRGGPAGYTEVPITMILHSMRDYREFGTACAQGVVIGIMLLIVSFALIRVSKDTRQE